jgi:hypothetical protein
MKPPHYFQIDWCLLYDFSTIASEEAIESTGIMKISIRGHYEMSYGARFIPAMTFDDPGGIRAAPLTPRSRTHRHLLAEFSSASWRETD